MLTLADVKEWLDISHTDNDGLLTALLTASDKDLRLKVGDYDEDSELASLYRKYWIGCLYADRFGELNNKTASATKQAMENILFALRLEVDAHANDDDES